MKRYSVLTYIFGGYEKLREVEEADPEAEYICITDDADMKSDTWTVIVDPLLKELPAFYSCCAIRYNPFKYCNTNICVKIDAAILVKKPLKPIIDSFEKKGYDMATMIHPNRNTMLMEYLAWEKIKGYPYEQTVKCLNVMNKFGYDIFDYKGLFEIGITIQKNNEVNGILNLITFEFLKALGEGKDVERIDQTIFSFIVNKFFEGRIKVMPLSKSILTNSQFFQLYNHNSDEKIPDFPNKIEPYLFNRKVEFVEF